jgi:hypothetical protein
MPKSEELNEELLKIQARKNQTNQGNSCSGRASPETNQRNYRKSN